MHMYSHFLIMVGILFINATPAALIWRGCDVREVWLCDEGVRCEEEVWLGDEGVRCEAR